MDRPVLSPDFTIEDIHKLREYNYYQTKDMSQQERIDYYNTRGIEVHKEIQARKIQKISSCAVCCYKNKTTAQNKKKKNHARCVGFNTKTPPPPHNS